MRILAFSDLHRNVDCARAIKAASADADVLVGAGDFATRGEGAGDTIQVLKSVKIPTIIVPGNHDNWPILQELCSDWRLGHLLHGAAVTIQGLPFFGLGGEIPSRNDEDWNFHLSEQDAFEMLLGCPSASVLVTHTPPHFCADLQADGTREGSETIRATVKDKQPVLHLCGHIHHSSGISGKIGKTRVHNLGPSINWFDV